MKPRYIPISRNFLRKINRLQLYRVSIRGRYAFPNELAKYFKDSDTLEILHIIDEYFISFDLMDCKFPKLKEIRYDNLTNYTLDLHRVPGLKIKHPIHAISKWKDTLEVFIFTRIGCNL
jgi:hypothetical protein